MAIILKTLKASGGDYSLMSTWESEIPLGTLADNYTLECYNDWPDGLEDAVEIVARTTSATNNIIITCPESERFSEFSNPNEASFDGFKIITTDATPIKISSEYTVVEYVGTSNTSLNNNSVQLTTGNIKVRFCGVYSRGATGALHIALASVGSVINRNVIYCDRAASNAEILINKKAHCVNNTLIALDLGKGLDVALNGGDVYNNVVIGGDGVDFDTGMDS